MLASALTTAFAVCPADAKEIETNMARLQAMDKITGKVSVIEAPVNAETKFGSFSIVVRACKTRPPEETPDNFAFVDVVDNYKSENPVNIFRGWMISSSLTGLSICMIRDSRLFFFMNGTAISFQ